MKRERQRRSTPKTKCRESSISFETGEVFRREKRATAGPKRDGRADYLHSGFNGTTFHTVGTSHALDNLRATRLLEVAGRFTTGNRPDGLEGRRVNIFVDHADGTIDE